MELLFSSASLLNLNYEFEFVGNTYNFRNRKDLSIEGTIYISSGVSGVAPIWSGISGIISTQRDYADIVLNGTSFGSGRLNSINFENGLDVRQKKYTASFSVFSTGNISNLNQQYYSGLYTGLTGVDLRSLESVDESFTFNTNSDNTYSYSRNLSLKLQSGTSSAHLSGLHNQAKSIAQIFFGSDISFPILLESYPNFYLSSGRKTHSESYDLVNSEYSFTETFSFQSGQNYIWLNDYSISRSEAGETIVTENGTFKGIDTTKYAATLSAFSGNFSGSFSRCSGIYSYYNGTGCNLKNFPIDTRIDRDTYLGEIKYSTSFSDSEKYQQSVIWDYTHSIKNSDGNIEIEEDGSVIGIGNKTGRYAIASGFYQNTVYPGVSARISGYYTGTTGILQLSCQDSFLQDSSSLSDSVYAGKIDYSFTYSNDSRLSTGNYSYREISYSNNYSVPLKNTYPILGDRNSEYVVGVYRGNSSLGQFSYNINLTPSGNLDINTMTLYAKGLINTGLIPSTEFYMKDAGYSYDFNQKQFSLNVNYDYVKYKQFNDITI